MLDCGIFKFLLDENHQQDSEQLAPSQLAVIRERNIFLAQGLILRGLGIRLRITYIFHRHDFA